MVKAKKNGAETEKSRKAKPPTVKDIKIPKMKNEKHGLDNDNVKKSNGVLKKLKTDTSLSSSIVPDSTKHPLEYLLKEFDIANFLETYWEKKPLILHAKEIKPSINVEVFSKSVLEKLLKEEDIIFGRDIHACRCVSGVTEDKNPKKSNRVLQKDLKRLFDGVGATIQFHQPQRFVDTLWDIMEKLETFFTCLVGANAYITPIGTQGLAPHYDDVEVFIIQLEGEKHWKLYEAPVKHAREYKSNIPLDTIGKLTHDFVLKPGDVLYMPRGTVHEAESPSNCASHSTHITLSTYQKHSWGDYLLTTFPEILEKALNNSDKFRKGLPIGYLQSPLNKDYFLELMSELPKTIESSLPSSQSLVEDFMLCRLPPFGINLADLEDGPNGRPPNIDSLIKLAYPKHMACCRYETPDDDEEDETENDSESNQILVYTSLFNDKRNHMISSKDAVATTAGTLKFPENHSDALHQLISCKEFTLVKDLRLESDSEKVQLSIALWAQNLLCVQ